MRTHYRANKLMVNRVRLWCIIFVVVLGHCLRFHFVTNHRRPNAFGSVSKRSFSSFFTLA